MAFKKTFVLSDESVNCFGFKILTAGIDLTQAKKNCPAFFNHQTWALPLGHWENLRLEDNKLLGDLVIEGDNEEEKDYIRKIQNGDIKGVSGGFDPVVWNDDPKQLSQGQTRPTLEKCKLIEGSIAPLPGNDNALALKTQGGFISLSVDNQNQFLPELKSEPDMKQIALKLGLAETATEQQILDAIAAIQLNSANTEALRLHVEAQAKEELDSPEKQALFAKLSKTSVPDALEFLKLSRVPGTTDEVVETPAQKGAIRKDVTLSSLVKDAKEKKAQDQQLQADGKDTYDYLQKHDKAELARIHKEEPARYAQLSKAYGEGVRYKGK